MSGLDIYSALLTALLLLLILGLAINGDITSGTTQPPPVALGSDPLGFVPGTVAEPPRWTSFTHQSLIADDVFSSWEKTQETVNRLIASHSSAVRIQGHHANWVHDDGTVSKLQATFTPPSMGQDQVYFLHGLHQMHCIIVILDAYGSSLEAQRRTQQHHHHASRWKWPSSHVAYCLNVLADMVRCTADATPLSFVNGFGVGHLTDGQMRWCRDWDALVAWAQSPERSLNVSGVADQVAALEGRFGNLWRAVLP